MAWHKNFSLEIRVEMISLSSTPWLAVEDALYLFGLREKERGRERVVERNASQIARREYARRVREWKENAKARVVASRCCPVCREMYIYTAWDKAYGRHVACSSHCRHLHRSGWEIIRIDGKANTLFGWAKHFGLNEETVRYRIKKKGWDPKRALTTPITPPGERGGGRKRLVA